jgi:hypothetical protein
MEYFKKITFSFHDDRTKKQGLVETKHAMSLRYVFCAFTINEPFIFRDFLWIF